MHRRADGSLTGRGVFVRVVAFGLAVGLLAAACQVAWQVGWAVLGHRVVFVSRDAPWMAPIGWLAFTLGVSVPLGAVAALVGARWSIGVATGVLVGLGVLVFMLRTDAIALWACFLVAAGAGVRCGTLVMLHPGTAGRVVRWAALGSLATLATLEGAMRWRANSSPSRELATTQGRPSIVLIVLDVVRAVSLSTYGFDQETSPFLSRLASEGLLVERALSPSPWTLPSHATMFTGRYAPASGVGFRQALPEELPTLAEVLRGQGYATGGFTANATYTAWDSGLSRGFDIYHDYRQTLLQATLSAWVWQVGKLHDALRATGGLRRRLGGLRYGSWRIPPNLSFDVKTGDLVADDFLDWQRQLPAGRPFFAFLNMFDAHVPRHAPPEYLQRLRDSVPDRKQYHGAIAYMDAQVERIADSLRVRGVLDSTIFVVVADHGELFGERQYWGHTWVVDRDLLWVPLVIRYPGRIGAGTRLTGPASLRDLPATLLDLASTPGGLPGSSLFRPVERSPAFAYLHQAINPHEGQPNAPGAVSTVILDTLQYIRYPSGQEMFVGLGDIRHTGNLLGMATFADVLARARHLTDSLARNRAP